MYNSFRDVQLLQEYLVYTCVIRSKIRANKIVSEWGNNVDYFSLIITFVNT